MNAREEQCYTQGNRVAWRQMLAECLRQLGVEDAEAGKARYLLEREDTIAHLRTLCEEVGDNNWDDRLYLADIVEKHLSKHLL